MTTVTNTYEVWDGLGKHRLTTSDQSEAYGLVHELRQQDVWAKVYRNTSWRCQKCGDTVENSDGGDVDCPSCGACYNAGGQRLRDDWRDNPSNYDDEVDDMEGYEVACLRRERETGEY